MVPGQHQGRTSTQGWHSPAPFLLASGHGIPIFPVASWCWRQGEWRQTGFLVEGAVITVGCREQLWWSLSDLGLQVRKGNTNGSPRQGQDSKCHHDFSGSPLSAWKGPRMESGTGVWLGRGLPSLLHCVDGVLKVQCFLISFCPQHEDIRFPRDLK